MRSMLFNLFKCLIVLVLFGKVLNWILDFSDDTNRLLNAAMFSLIGVAYIVMGYVWENKLAKGIITTCGLYLISMNFFYPNTLLEVLGIASILIPMVIARFYKEKKVERQAVES